MCHANIVGVIILFFIVLSLVLLSIKTRVKGACDDYIFVSIHNFNVDDELPVFQAFPRVSWTVNDCPRTGNWEKYCHFEPFYPRLFRQDRWWPRAKPTSSHRPGCTVHNTTHQTREPYHSWQSRLSIKSHRCCGHEKRDAGRESIQTTAWVHGHRKRCSCW